MVLKRKGSQGDEAYDYYHEDGDDEDEDGEGEGEGRQDDEEEEQGEKLYRESGRYHDDEIDDDDRED